LSRDWDYTSMRTETDEAFGRLFAKTDEADRKVGLTLRRFRGTADMERFLAPTDL
jgi:hypothetical protein